jgi:hypothetical protein
MSIAASIPAVATTNITDGGDGFQAYGLVAGLLVGFVFLALVFFRRRRQAKSQHFQDMVRHAETSLSFKDEEEQLSSPNDPWNDDELFVVDLQTLQNMN